MTRTTWGPLLGGALWVLMAACGRTPPPSAELRIDTVDLREGQVLGAGRDADPAAPGFQLDVAIRVTDVNGVAVPLRSATLEWREEPDAQFKEKSEGSIDGEKASFPRLTLPATTVILRIEATEKDGTRKVAVIRKLQVDLAGPVISAVTSPVAGETYDNTEVAIEATVTGADGRPLKVSRREGTTRTQVGEVTIVDGLASGTLSFAPGTFDVVLSVDDAEGNTAEAEVLGVTVTSAGCAIQITSPDTRPMRYGLAHDLDPATEGLQATVNGTSPACAGRQVNLSRSGGAFEATETIQPDGSFSLPVTLSHGEATRLTVTVADGASIVTTDFVDVTVDLVAPTVEALANDAASLFFVADTNIHLGTACYFVDGVAGGDAQATLQVTVSGEIGDEVFVEYGGVEVSARQVISSSPQTLEVAVELPHGGGGPLTVVAEDPAGNRGVIARDAVVDVIAPAAPVVSADIVNARRATVEVSWTASGDDGADGSVAGYDLRYSTAAVLEHGIETLEHFLTSDGPEPLTKRVSEGLIPAGTLTESLTLPPFVNYSFNVLAVDSIGNRSAFSDSLAVTNSGEQIVLVNPTDGDRFGWRVATGDFDNDGIQDLAVANDGANGFAGEVHIYRGGETLSSSSQPDQTVSPSVASGTQYFGTGLAAGRVTGQPHADLLVGASTWEGNRGRAFLYFGDENGPVDATPVEFRGNGPNGYFGSVMNVVADINGDGINEIAITASSDMGGRVYLYFGRSESAWRAAATATDTEGSAFVPYDAADRVFQAPEPPEGSTNVLFGRDSGLTALGDLDGDGGAEVAVAASRSNVGSVYIFSSASIVARSGAALVDRTLGILDAQHVVDGSVDSSINLGFGYRMAGGSHVMTGEGFDLVVAHARESLVYRVNGLTGTGPIEAELLFQGTEGQNFGAGLTVADLNGDGFLDVVVGENPPTTAPSSEGWIMFHTGDPEHPYESRTPNFNMARMRSLGPSRGLDVAVADLDGDGKLDVISTEMLNAPGRVYVRH